MKNINLVLLFLLAVSTFSLTSAKGVKKYDNIQEITKDWDGKKPAHPKNWNHEYISGMEVNPADIIDFRSRVEEEKG